MRTFAATHGATVSLTERIRHASELATQALHDGCELIVAVGGDGTMNEVATVLVGTTATLGLVPCGSGDGLGRHLGLHGSAAHAFKILLHGRSRLIDSGLADGRPFFTAAGIGFEAEVTQRFNRRTRRGLLGYLAASATAFRDWQPQDVTVQHGGQREQFRAFTLVVANSDQYGNNVRIAPDARIDDGLLDLCAVPPVTCWNLLPLAVRSYFGSIGRVTGVNLRRSSRFLVERAAPGLLHTDGEMHDAGAQIEFVVRPASLRVMCPG